ncbi:MAG: GDYXXLXY domain-containing protein [Acetobacter sp.]|nr:GDYXXLXY domain-containing protein [Acetobacter sp.]
MLKKYGYIGLVFLPVFILLAWVATIEVQRHQGREVVVRLQGYDPRDLLSGHYILYQLDWDKTDCAQFENGVCPRAAFDRTGRFYVNENKAKALENVIRDKANKTEMLFSYRKGVKPLALRLLVNGKSWEEAVDKR